MGGSKTAKFVNVFSLESFALYRKSQSTTTSAYFHKGSTRKLYCIAENFGGELNLVVEQPQIKNQPILKLNIMAQSSIYF